MKNNITMTDKELVDLIESIKVETYQITNREVNRITSEYKTILKAVQDERSIRGNTRSLGVNWNCSDCVLSEIQVSFIPYLEGKHYKHLQDSLVPIQVHLKLVPDADPPSKVDKVAAKKR